MRYATAGVLIGSFFTVWTARGEDFSFKVSAHPPVVLRGIPTVIRGEITNVSGRTIKVANHGLEDLCNGLASSGFSVFTRATDDSGNRSDCIDHLGDWISMEVKSLPSGWREAFSLPVCISKPGTYKVEVVAASDPKTYFPNIISTEVWSGEAKSDAVTVTILDPTGEDRAAYEYFCGKLIGATSMSGCVFWRPDLLLRMFPTSTYAAYEVYLRGNTKGRLEGLLDTDRALRNLVGDLGAPPQANHVPCDEPPCYTNKAGVQWKSLSGEAYAAWRQKWYDIVLRAHPDIWFADELRFHLACDQFQLGNRHGFASSMEALTKQGRPDVAEKAAELLALLKANGLLN